MSIFLTRKPMPIPRKVKYPTIRRMVADQGGGQMEQDQASELLDDPSVRHWRENATFELFAVLMRQRMCCAAMAKIIYYGHID